jgi:ubiquinone/menaquinone biosynthesis C-methylase UbiE
MAATREIRFDNGAEYEQTMGRWSRLAGVQFLQWLAMPAGLDWIDIGCGNGAFTELVIEATAPSRVAALDPSEGQLAFARQRAGCSMATFENGQATSLAHPDDAFDVAVMALVLFFVPDPAKGLAEMMRVVRPGGTVAAYVWDIPRGGFPYEAVWSEMQGLGVETGRPPSVQISRMEALKELWRSAGLEGVATREIVVERTYPGFEVYWTSLQTLHSASQIRDMEAGQRDELRRRLQARLPSDEAGRVTFSARANAIKGLVPPGQRG